MKPFPLTIRLSDVKNVERRPFLQVLREPRDLINGINERDEGFTKRSEHIYKHIFNFIKDEGFNLNIIISGDIIENLHRLDPETFETLKTLAKDKQVQLIVDSYYSESNTSLYYQLWWRDGLKRTVDTCKELLKVTPKAIYVPYLYRSLELETVVEETGIKEFLMIGKTIKSYRFFRECVADFRRYNGDQPTWISDEQNVKCTFHFIPDTHFFNINKFVLGQVSSDHTKAVTMGIGSMIFRQKVLTPHIKGGSGYKPRIPEYPSISEYNDIQKAMHRLWGYVAKLTLSEYRLHDSEFIKKMYDAVGRMQNSDYLLYCQKEMYKQESLDFTSPYEFFANSQASVENVLILLKNKL